MNYSANVSVVEKDLSELRVTVQVTRNASERLGIESEMTTQFGHNDEMMSLPKSRVTDNTHVFSIDTRVKKGNSLKRWRLQRKHETEPEGTGGM